MQTYNNKNLPTAVSDVLYHDTIPLFKDFQQALNQHQDYAPRLMQFLFRDSERCKQVLGSFQKAIQLLPNLTPALRYDLINFILNRHAIFEYLFLNNIKGCYDESDSSILELKQVLKTTENFWIEFLDLKDHEVYRHKWKIALLKIAIEYDVNKENNAEQPIEHRIVFAALSWEFQRVLDILMQPEWIDYRAAYMLALLNNRKMFFKYFVSLSTASENIVSVVNQLSSGRNVNQLIEYFLAPKKVFEFEKVFNCFDKLFSVSEALPREARDKLFSYIIKNPAQFDRLYKDPSDFFYCDAFVFYIAENCLNNLSEKENSNFLEKIINSISKLLNDIFIKNAEKFAKKIVEIWRAVILYFPEVIKNKVFSPIFDSLIDDLVNIAFYIWRTVFSLDYDSSRLAEYVDFISMLPKDSAYIRVDQLVKYASEPEEEIKKMIFMAPLLSEKEHLTLLDSLMEPDDYKKNQDKECPRCLSGLNAEGVAVLIANLSLFEKYEQIADHLMNYIFEAPEIFKQLFLQHDMQLLTPVVKRIPEKYRDRFFECLAFNCTLSIMRDKHPYIQSIASSLSQLLQVFPQQAILLMPCVKVFLTYSVECTKNGKNNRYTSAHVPSVFRALSESMANELAEHILSDANLFSDLRECCSFHDCTKFFPKYEAILNQSKVEEVIFSYHQLLLQRDIKNRICELNDQISLMYRRDFPILEYFFSGLVSACIQRHGNMPQVVCFANEWFSHLMQDALETIRWRVATPSPRVLQDQCSFFNTYLRAVDKSKECEISLLKWQ